jgi:tetratricopeptide (TPR) repeat protein
MSKQLRLYDPNWDRDTKLRVNHDSGSTAAIYLASVRWILGEVVGTRRLTEEAVNRAVELDHVQTLAVVHWSKGLFEAICKRFEVALREAETLVKLCGEHAIPLYLAIGRALGGWARACVGDVLAGATDLREALVTYSDQGNKAFIPFLQGLLAEVEAEAGAVDKAFTEVEKALVIASDTGEHWSDSLLHRIRGGILLKRDPTNRAPAEEAFLTAIAIAQQQKAKSFELRAALSLAKLYQSTHRAADAHAVLAPALEGFSRTPEFPETTEAQTLLAALAETEEVKKAAAARQRRLKLQTDYGQAVMWSRGFLADETKVAFARARELTAGTDNSAGRFIAYYAQWAGQLSHAELEFARETAETFRREAENEGQATELVVGLRMLGLTCLFQGDFLAARAHLEEALKRYDPQRDHVAFANRQIRGHVREAAKPALMTPSRARQHVKAPAC